ncbi:MAG: hypothetical protein JW820_17145 [Spirochaetales bacterium]|nr:hypothetical protein [Spirochaetales bacterium]
MGIFGKPNRSADASLAIAASGQTAARMLGAPLSLGVKMVSSEILAGRAASRGLVTSSEAFRLGVVSAFTLSALLRPDVRSLGVLLGTTADIAAAYREDPLGVSRVPLKDYLSAFGIDLLPDGQAGITGAQDAASGTSRIKKYLAITHDVGFLNQLARIRRGIVIHPVVKDDGQSACLLQR